MTLRLWMGSSSTTIQSLNEREEEEAVRWDLNSRKLALGLCCSCGFRRMPKARYGGAGWMSNYGFLCVFWHGWGRCMWIAGFEESRMDGRDERRGEEEKRREEKGRNTYEDGAAIHLPRYKFAMTK